MADGRAKESGAHILCIVFEKKPARCGAVEARRKRPLRMPTKKSFQQKRTMPLK